MRSGRAAARWTFSFAFVSLLPTLAVAGASTTDLSPRLFYGYANQDPPNWERKPRTSVLVTFCARKAALAKGALVTAVPASPVLPALVVRVKGSKRLRHDPCIVMSAEPVTDPAWRDVGWEKGGAWSYPLLLVVDGEHPKARPLKPETLPAVTLPPETEPKDVMIAADIDGDGAVDAIERAACEDGTRACEDIDCKEIWIRTENRWRRTDQMCGD